MRKVWFKIIVALIIIIILIFSQYDKRNNKFYNGTKLNGIEFINSKNIGLPTQILLIDSNLIIIDDKPLYESRKIKIYNLLSKKEISIGDYGAGPGEFIQPISLNKVIGVKNSFTVNDLSMFRITQYIFNKNKCVISNVYKLKGGMPIQTVLLNNRRIIALCFGLTNGRMAIYDTAGTIIEEIGQIPQHIIKDMPTPIVLQAYIGQLKVKPDGNVYVVSAQYSDIIDIYNNEGKLVSKIVGPINHLPQFRVAKVVKFPVMALNVEKTIYGYIDIFTDKKYIYTLFSGNKFKEHKFEGHFIHVYNYSGEFIKTYVLSEDISYFTFDNINNCIYGVQIYPRVKLLKFNITT